MKILVYGDSNVWGDGHSSRLEKRWTNLLQDKNYQIIEEGLPGRIAGNDEKLEIFKNGKDNFVTIFRSAAPVDKIIIALGSNDLQDKYNKSAKQLIEDLLWYKKELEEWFNIEKYRNKYFNNKFPEIIYILPSNIKATDIFHNVEERRNEIIDYFKDKENYIVLNDLELVSDGLHFNVEDHIKMADKVLEYLNK